MRFLIIFTLCLLILAAPPAHADGSGAPRDARAYEDLAARRGIDTEVLHPPADAPIPRLGDIAPPPIAAEVDAPAPDGGNTTLVAISVALLLAAIWAAVHFGGARAVSFAHAPGSDPRRRAAPAMAPLPPEAPDLARIAAMADRRAAAEALWLAALGRAAAAHGLTIGRSWTARDALRRVPGAWPHRAALTRLARAAELARFGGREVPEDQFRALLDAAAPIFAGRAP